MSEGPVIIHQSERILIHAYTDKLVAVILEGVGSFKIQRKVEKQWPHAEDLFALSVRGLLQLTKEFHDEVIKTLLN